MVIMQLRLIVLFSLLLGLCNNVYCAKIYIGHFPQTLNFGSSEALRLSEFGDVIAGSLGYTTVSTWPGLTISSPFGYPLAFVLVHVVSNGHDVNMKGKMYNVKQESNLNSVYEFVRAKMNTQSERPLSFQDITLSEIMTELKQAWVSDPVSLDQAVSEDDNFIHQMEVLPSVFNKIEKFSRVGHGGQDVTFLEVESLNSLIKKYGSNSSQVTEADYILRKSLIDLEDNVRKFYGDRVVFATVFTDNVHHLSKRASPFIDAKEDLEDVKLVEPYSEEFPVVFNIVLFLSIILILAIIASSASMALMDPGHDSIIYRMTNPRMKKD